jgi:hypothetical protein
MRAHLPNPGGSSLAAYCTELMKSSLASADKQRAPKNREALLKEFMAGNGKFTHDEIVARNRAVTA